MVSHIIIHNEKVLEFPFGKEKAACFTFDDCNWSSHRIAIMLFLRRVHATFFLNTRLVTNKFHYRFQYRVLRWMGFELGTHTRNHVVLTKVDNEKVEEELKESKDDIKNTYGIIPSVFSYPESCSSESTDEIALKYYHALRYNTHIDGQVCYHVRTKTTAEEYAELTENFIKGSDRALVIGAHGVDGCGYEPIGSNNLWKWVKCLKRYNDKVWFPSFGELTIWESIKGKVNCSLKDNILIFDTSNIDSLMRTYPDTPFFYSVCVQADDIERIITVDLRKQKSFKI